MLKVHVFRKAVASNTVPERLTTSNIRATWVRIQAEDDNTGVTFVGDSEVSSANGIELKVCAGGDADARNVPALELYGQSIGSGFEDISLKDIWLAVATSADGVICLYTTRE